MKNRPPGLFSFVPCVIFGAKFSNDTQLSRLRRHQFAQHPQGVGLPGHLQMGIPFGCLDAGVSQNFSDCVQINAKADQDRCAGMAQIVEVDVLHSLGHPSALPGRLDAFKADRQREVMQPRAQGRDDGHGAHLQRLGVCGRNLYVIGVDVLCFDLADLTSARTCEQGAPDRRLYRLGAMLCNPAHLID